MSETAAQIKEDQTAASPEKEVVEKKAVEDDTQANGLNESNGDKKKNGLHREKDEDQSEDEKSVENGDQKQPEPTGQKRKSDVNGGDATDNGAAAEGVSPEKKAKLEEKVENGEAEATA